MIHGVFEVKSYKTSPWRPLDLPLETKTKCGLSSMMYETSYNLKS